ncbi:hypothetical protein COU78_04010 [Candidatus Peregrinibacteria bacterium CG10_big_fil_rev_8_21_14_0_10_49_24]|nr:MAG: hypothetical protein COU78_04010 [Candidatus Peregrinibacteria bacterium CG10_big_fil_rev_8_21_14_0_10_49_24]
MHEDLDVTLVDDGTTVTVTVGQYTVSGETTGSYSGFKTGVSNWSGRTVVDDYRIAYSPAAEEGGSQLQLMQAQIAVSAELTAQLQEEAVILETELAQESAVLLTSVSVRNQELSRIQGVQLFERSSFYVHGNEIEPILQRTLPHIFPENLQAYIEEQAVLLNEEPGHIQDRILMQQSDYRSIARGLLGYYENAMGDLLNASVDMSARVTAGESEHDLMEALRYQRAIAGNGRYLTEIAFYGIHLPTAEELYQEGRQLFGQEHDLLTKIQSEQDRLQTIENFRAGNRAWQLAHGVPDLAVLIGADEGSADNGYQGELSEAQQRRLGRAQRLVETAMSSMLDRRIQMRIVPDDMVIEDRLRYGGNGITYFDVHADEQETAVRGVTGVIQGNLTSVEGAAEGITASGATFLQTARVQFSEGTDISNLGLIDTETNLRSTESLHVPQGGESALFFTLTEEKMVNIWMNGMAMRDVSLTLQGGQLPAGGYSSAHEGAAGESVSLRLPSGTYTVSVRDDTNYDGGTMATGNFTVPLELEMKSFHSANIEGRISIAERPVTMPVSMRVADYIQNQDGQLVKNENYDGLDTTKPKVNGLNADKPVWVVVHGRGDREGSSKMNDLAKALSATGRQVVTSDWEDAAKDNGFGFLEGADWIPAVGSWIASQLKAAGFHGEQIRIAGHSWGSFVAYEIGKNFLGKDGNTENDFGVQSIVALDSAKDPLPVNSYPASEVSFADVSKASWALKSSFFGSSARANSADVSFDLVIPSELQEQNNPFLIPTQKALLDAAQAYLNEHGYAVSCFANLIRAQGEEGFAALNITDLEAGTLPAIPLNAGDADGHMFLDFVQVTDETGTWWQAVPKTLQIP